MEPKEIFKMKAEANTKHLLAKLDEAEADALDKITENEEKINLLKVEVKACVDKKETLQRKFEAMKNANEASWEKANKEFIESIEAIEDKNIFRSKTEEWFKNIRNTSAELKEGIKERVAQW